MLSLFWEYFDASTIHGLNYIHPRNHLISRLLWSIIFLLGFLASGIIIRDAFTDWDNNPVITTMDSIAASIEDIQRPTVTVCRNEDKPPDNWIPIEVILNLLAFACTDNDYYRYQPGFETLPACNKTQKIRQDFSFLLELAADYIMQFVRDPDLQEGYDSSEISLREKIAVALTDGDIKVEDFQMLPVKNLGVKKDTNALLRSLINETDSDYLFSYFNYYYYEDKANCSSTKCQDMLKLIDGTIQALNDVDSHPNLPFGSFLALFLSEAFSEFRGDKKVIHYESAYEYSYSSIQDQRYLDTHKILVKISKYFGFHNNETISLFDLPAMMSTRKTLRIANMKMSQSYAFSIGQNNISFDILNGCFNAWEYYTEDPEGKTHPCDIDDWKQNEYHSLCCMMGPKMIGYNLEAVMRVMRLALGRGKSRFNMTEILEDVLDDLEYPMMIDRNELVNYQSVKDVDSMIPFCQLNDAKEGDTDTIFTMEPECHLFDPVITDLGVCHSFNAMNTGEMLRFSYFQQSFANAFISDFGVGQEILNGSGSGEDHSLQYYLLDPSVRRMSDSESSPSPFHMSLSTKADYFDIATKSHKIHPGLHTTWTVQAMEIAPSDDLREVSIEKRNCRFSDESSHLKIFKVYSKKACLFECQLEKAAAVCKCYPWYIPAVPNQGRHVLCDHFGNYCFRRVMKRSGLSKNCTKACLPTCHHIEFTHISKEKAIDVSVCNSLGRNDNPLGSRIYRFISLMQKNGYNTFSYNYLNAKEWKEKSKFPNQHHNETFVRWMSRISSEMDINQKLCQKIIRHMAIVTVMFDKDTFVRTKTSLRVSSSEKLAAFGGTLGLFTGMSILSMIEAAFWLLKLCWYFMKPIQSGTLRGAKRT